MSVTHVHNEVNRLIREYELSNKDVKLLAEKIATINTPEYLEMVIENESSM